MYKFLTLLTGIILALMIGVNGILTDGYGVLWSSVIIHTVGMIAVFIILKLKQKSLKIFLKAPLILYMGGVIGILTVLFNNYAFSKITITSIGALGLFGQTISSLVIDYFGLLGMKKIKFTWTNFITIIFGIGGIVIMLDFNNLASVLAVILSILTGLSIVLARILNSKLAEKIGLIEGTFVNFLAGVITTLLLAIIFARDEMHLLISNAYPWWVYLGGLLGVGIVFLGNVTVPRLSSFDLTILAFVGQVGASAVLDISFGTGINSSFYGGLVVAVGIIVSTVIEKYRVDSKNQM